MAKLEKVIRLEMAGRLHSAFRSIITHPPSGYKVYSTDYYKTLGFDSRNWARRALDTGLGLLSDAGVPCKLLRSVAGLFARVEEADLTITNGILDLHQHNWAPVVEEGLSSFMGTVYDRKSLHPLIESILARDNCRGILCFNKAARNSLLTTYARERLAYKSYVIYPAIPRVPRRVNRIGRKKVNILLLGSINFQVPEGFYIKGGHLAYRAFSKLRREFDNISLVIRAVVPPEYIRLLKSDPNVVLLDRPLSVPDLANLLDSADIFLLPCKTTPWTSFLDAMNHSLPMVTINTNANGELVRNGVAGFVADVPSEFRSIMSNYYIPDRATLNTLRKMWYESEAIVDNLIPPLRALIQDEELRLRMGAAARSNLEPGGVFSIERRNEQLGDFFDKAIE